MGILEQYTGSRGRGHKPKHPGWHEFSERQKRIIREESAPSYGQILEAGL